MFCSNCGAKAEGRFCAHCGHQLSTEAESHAVRGEWRDEIQYEKLLRHVEVRDQIARHAGLAHAGLSGEKFLELCDKVFAPLMSGVSLAAVTNLALPIYAQLGIQTGKRQATLLPLRPGDVLVATLCSLAQRGQKIRSVQQESDACQLTAELPSDLRTMTGGELHIVLRKQGGQMFVEAWTYIPGQLYDWGKSAQILAQLFTHLQQHADSQIITATAVAA